MRLWEMRRLGRLGLLGAGFRASDTAGGVHAGESWGGLSVHILWDTVCQKEYGMQGSVDVPSPFSISGMGAMWSLTCLSSSCYEVSI
jgi:hypothetical protein